MNYTIKNEYYTITVSQLGAELVSVKGASGFEFIWQNTGKFWDSHAPLLFPACGCIKGSKYTLHGVEYPLGAHGFLKNMEFAVASKEGGHITMTFTSNAETRKSYPFDFTAVADYELRADEIIFSFTVKNTGCETMPYMFGWHPGFALPTDAGKDIEDYIIDMGGDITSLNWYPLQNGPYVCPEPKEYKLPEGKYRLCEEEIYKNDTLIFTAHNNTVKMYTEGHPYSLTFSWSDNLPYLCIWKDDSNDAKFICLEPWSDVPGDGITPENFDTRKMSRLPAGSAETYTYKIKAKI